MPYPYHRRIKLDTLALRSSEVRRLLSKLDTHDGVNPLRFLSVFFKELAFVHKLSIVFCTQSRVGLFSFQLCSAGVKLIPKRTTFFLLTSFRLLSIRQSCRRLSVIGILSLVCFHGK